MSIFSRVSDIINANVNDLLDRAEDPEKMVKMLILEMEEQIEIARQGIAKAIAGEKKLEANLTKNRDEAEAWAKKAEAAMARGDEESARQCISRKLEHNTIVDSLRPQWEKARQTSDVLKSDLRRMEEKLDETIRRRDSLIARQMAAEAQKQVQSVTPSLHRAQRTLAKFDRMERRVEDMEAEAAAMSELSQMSTELNGNVEKKQRDADVENVLAALRNKVSSK